MTNQNAIIELKIIRNVYANMRIEYRSCVEALDMAISSLQEQILNDYFEEVRKHTDIYREIKTKGDLIERQAAIDECNKRGAEHIGYAIAHLPSAQPDSCNFPQLGATCEDGDELDEVMQHWIKQADEQEKVAEMYPEYADECKKISNDFRQLASWLWELKRLRIKYNNYKTDHGYMWICPDCGLMVHSDFKRCVRCGNERSDLS